MVKKTLNNFSFVQLKQFASTQPLFFALVAVFVLAGVIAAKDLVFSKNQTLDKNTSSIILPEQGQAVQIKSDKVDQVSVRNNKPLTMQERQALLVQFYDPENANAQGILEPLKRAGQGGLAAFNMLTNLSNLPANINLWVGQIINGFLDSAYVIIFGKGIDPLAQGEPPLEPLISAKETIQAGYLGGGALTYASLNISQGITEPPVATDLAYFYDRQFKNNNLLSTPSYAQSFERESNEFRRRTFELWVFSRNMALSMAAVFLSIGGLAIMFRKRISPQATISISNVLPYVPIALLGILLSYPLLALLNGLNAPLMEVARSIGGSVAEAVSGSSNINLVRGSVYSLIAIALATMLGAIGLGVLSIPVILIGLVLGVMLLILWIRWLYEYIKVTIMFVMLAFMFPFAAVISLIPGKQDAIFLVLKKALVNTLVLPIITLFFYIGMGFILGMGSAAFNSNGGILGTISILPPIIMFSIGFGIIWKTLSVRKMLEEALGAGGSVMSIVQGGGGDDKRGGGRR